MGIEEKVRLAKKTKDEKLIKEMFLINMEKNM